MLRKLVFSTILFLSVPLWAQSVKIDDAKVRAFIPGTSSSVAYFSLHNQGDKEITIVGAQIEGLNRVEIHHHIEKNGMMKMVQLKSLSVNAGEKVIFQPGGLHLMLFEPTANLIIGEQVSVTLLLESGDKVKATADIVKLVTESHHHHHH